jgi:hypothetical protein
MNPSTATHHPPFARSLAVVIAAAASLALLIALSVALPTAAAQGWLVAFVLWSSVAMGAPALLMIHRLTGGEWGAALSPVLVPLAAMLPLLLLGFVPVALGLHLTFSWSWQPTEPPSLGELYLNAPSFIGRGLAMLAGLSFLALLAALGRMTRLAAGIGLSFYGLMINLIGADWILSLQPGFGSTAFGMELATQQMLMALAVAATLGPEPPSGQSPRDLAGLLIATLLGTVYIGLMTFIVDWYGDLPVRASWYLLRSHGVWLAVLLAAIVAGTLLPLALLMRESVRNDRRALRRVGALILCGSALHLIWLMGPPLQPAAFLIAPTALVVLILLSATSAGWILARAERASHG